MLTSFYIGSGFAVLGTNCLIFMIKALSLVMFSRFTGERGAACQWGNLCRRLVFKNQSLPFFKEIKAQESHQGIFLLLTAFVKYTLPSPAAAFNERFGGQVLSNTKLLLFYRGLFKTMKCVVGFVSWTINCFIINGALWLIFNSEQEVKNLETG